MSIAAEVRIYTSGVDVSESQHFALIEFDIGGHLPERPAQLFGSRWKGGRFRVAGHLLIKLFERRNLDRLFELLLGLGQLQFCRC